MVRRLLVGVMAAGLPLVGAPVFAQPPVTTTTVQKNLVETFDVIPTCEEGGPLYTITLTSNLVMHETVFDDGRVHARPSPRPAPCGRAARPEPAQLHRQGHHLGRLQPEQPSRQRHLHQPACHCPDGSRAMSTPPTTSTSGPTGRSMSSSTATSQHRIAAPPASGRQARQAGEREVSNAHLCRAGQLDRSGDQGIPRLGGAGERLSSIGRAGRWSGPRDGLTMGEYDFITVFGGSR